ncbi:YfiR family protein [Azoarcus sp. L1K30]|uniref:YfiR family protein n=1 Tax=Azoarcus sp. L1K30 TaxID=2820277 RepID=UPI001B840413|nr:YfiR family protein [Azoarcus sp. L1K30]MBR0567149.1 YfiR family protein [Azoarcus sp. L1K30]
MRILVVGCAVVLASALALPGRSMAQQQATEPDLKAAILVNMLLFVDWPRGDVQPNAALSVCYFSNSAVAGALAALDRRVIRGRQLNVVRVDASALQRCQAAYIAPSDDVLLSALSGGALPGGVLLVGDTPGFLDRGVMVNLALFEGRVTFDVDLPALRRAGLSLSSKALRLARTVRE